MPPRNEVSIWIRAKDLASGVFKKLERGWQASIRVAKQFAIGITAIGAAAGAAMVALGRLAQRGGEVLGVQRAFGRTFGDGAAALQVMREQTRGLITDYDLMQNANQAVALGAAETAEEFAKMARLAQDLDRALGLGGEGLEKLTVALARQSKLRLDDLGIIINTTRANEAYADQLDRNASSLTEAEKKIAFRNEALRRGAELVEKMGAAELGAADNANRAAAAIENFRDRLSVMVSESPTVSAFFESVANLGTDIVDALNGDADVVVDAVTALGGLAGNAFAAAFLDAAAAGFNKIDTLILPKLFGIEEKFVTFFGAIGGGLQGFADDAREGRSAFRVALAAAGRAGRSGARARGLGRTAGGTGGGGGSGAAAAAAFDPGSIPSGFLPSLFRQFNPGIGLAAGATGPSPFATGGSNAQVPSIFRDAARFLRPVTKGVEEAGDGFKVAGDTVVGEFARMADAAVSGSGNMAGTVTAAFQDIIANIQTGSGGLFGSTLLGGIAVAGLGLIGGLFGRNRQPASVHVSGIDDAAARKIAEATEERPFRITNVNVTPEGKTIGQTEYELRRRERRDAVPRFIGGGG